MPQAPIDPDAADEPGAEPARREKPSVARRRRLRALERAVFRIALALALLGLAGVLGWTYWLNRQVARLEGSLRAAEAERRSFAERVERERRRSRRDRDSLQVQIEESKVREAELSRRLSEAAGGGEVRALRDELSAARSVLETLERERAVGERIIRQYGGGVCLIQGTYAFYDEAGLALRYRVDEAGQRVRAADGTLGVEVDGNGPIHTVDTVGTGFLVDRRGLVLTNRHVAEPWWKDATADALEQQGFRPRFVALRAFFPNVTEALELKLHRASPSVDLALLRADLEGRKIPVLPLDATGRGAVPGQPVVVVGYPSGLEALLAKADSGVVREILAAQGTAPERLTEALSHRGLIRPSTTQGHIGDVTRTDIVFDAPTTQGSSGGPVFNKHGRVIAVEYAVLSKFGGNSFGLPVRYAVELLRRPADGAAPGRPREAGAAAGSSP
ncbi:MAG TPA: serine protease [Vicinamibacteria bacterium]|nr:serine protease [Vicinamibacteria bacterium]